MVVFKANPLVTVQNFIRLLHKPKCQSLEQRKGLLQGQARRMGGSCSKYLNFLMVFREKFFVGKIGGEGYEGVCDYLLIAWW